MNILGWQQSFCAFSTISSLFFFFRTRISHQLCIDYRYSWLLANDLEGKGCRAHRSLPTSRQMKWRCRLLVPSLCRTPVRADCLREAERSDSLLESSIENAVEGAWFFKPATVIFRETTLPREFSHCRAECKFDPVFL